MSAVVHEQFWQYLGRGIASVWAAWWMFFVIADVLSDGTKPRQMILILFVASLIFLGSTLLAWKYEIAGGIVLLGVGIGLAVTYLRLMHHPQILVLLMLAVPPAIAGILLLIHTGSRR